MSISAINCTPIKPQVNFGRNDQYEKEYENFRVLSDEINDKFVKADDIKSPVAIGASVALAALASYKGAQTLTDKIASKFAPELGVKVENVLKKAGNSLKKTSSDLANKEIGQDLSNFKKIQGNAVKIAGKVMQGAEETARNIYKKVAYSGIDKELVNPQRASKALANVAGAGAATATVTDICTKDADGDGIKDIMQKSQNAYTGAKNTYGNAFETVGVLSELAQMFT